LVPDDLQAWTFETVVRIVRAGEFEPSTYDYKEVLTPTRGPAGEFNQSIRRTACSMANSSGGYILFGVLDRATTVSSPDDRIVGISLSGDLRKEFGDKLAGTVREIHFDTLLGPIAIPGHATRGIFVVRIPTSPLRPHQVTPPGVFYRRGDGGQAIPMDYYEVRDQMLLVEEQLRRMTLLRLELDLFRQQAVAISNLTFEGFMHRFDTSSFLSLVADVCGLLPPNSGLLSDLTDISKAAGWVNQFLEHAPLPASRDTASDESNMFIQKRNHLASQVATIEDACQKCERLLREIFGPPGQ
jgi:hypothetical protein